MENTNSKKTGGKNFFYAVSLGTELGFLIAVPLIVFLLAGLFLDRKFGTLPLFLIIFMILSMISTFVGIRYLILPFLEKRSQKKDNKQ